MVKYLQRIKLRGEKGLKGIALLSALFLLSSLTASAQYYQTKGPAASTLNWNSVSTWEISQTIGGPYVDATAVPNATNSKQVKILNEHTITITSTVEQPANMNIDQLIIDGTLYIKGTASNLYIMDDKDVAGPDLIVNGLLINEGYLGLNREFDEIGDVVGFPTAEIRGVGTINNSGEITSRTDNFTFMAGSTYDHQASSLLYPLPLATWDDGSTVKITGVSRYTNNTSLGNSNQIFGNFIWDTPAYTSTEPININPTRIKGDFTVKSTGMGRVIISNDLQVDQNLLVKGPGNLRLSDGDLIPQRIVTVNGNVEVSDGTFVLISGANTSAKVDLNISGNFKYIGGSITKGTAPIANINFKGKTEQLATINKNFNGAINFFVATGSVLNLGETSFIAANTETLKAASKFTVQFGGTVKIGNEKGINTTEGNIRLPQVYDPGSKVVFNGIATQVLGIDFPATASINLEVNNSAGVTMGKSLAIAPERSLTLTKGSLNIGGYTLTLNGNVAGPGGLGTISTSSLIINGAGPLGTLHFTSGVPVLKDLIINRTSSGTVTMGSPIGILGKLDLTAGTLIIKDNVLGLYSTATYTNGNISGNENTLILVGAVPEQTLGLPANFSQSTGNISLNFSNEGNVINTLTLGALATNSEVNINGNLTITKSLFLQEGILNKSAVGSLTLSDNSTIYRTNGAINFVPLTANNEAYNLVYYGALNIIGNEFSDGSSIRDLTIGGVNNVSNVYLGGSRTVGRNLTIVNGLLDQSNHLKVGGNLNIANGTLDQKSFNLNVNGDFTASTNSIYKASNGSLVIMSGNNNMPQTIMGSNLSFVNLNIANTGLGVTLKNNIAVRNQLTFTSGIIQTGVNRVLLGDAGFITGESDASHLLGNIQISKTLTAGTAEDFGNIGILMSPDILGPEPGSITVNRNTGNAISAATGSASIKRLFDINGPESGQNITMTLKYLDVELNGNDESTLTMFKSTVPSTWVKQEGTYTRKPDINEVTLTGVTGFSTWTMASPVSVLPVELTYFTAKKKGQTVELNWETVQEVDNQGFEVQVSTDAVSYRKIGFVSSKNQNSRNAQKYTFTDTGIRKDGGIFYYRLRQVDNNGEEKFYGPESVSFNREALAINAYPNPSSGIVQVEFEAGTSKEATVMVVDVHGKTVFSKQVATERGLNTLQIDLSNQSNGLYILTITSTSGKKQMKLIKK